MLAKIEKDSSKNKIDINTLEKITSERWNQSFTGSDCQSHIVNKNLEKLAWKYRIKSNILYRWSEKLSHWHPKW